MTLSSRHRIQNSITGGLRSRERHLTVTEFPHNIENFTGERGRNIFSLKLEGQSGVRTCDLQFSKQVDLATQPEQAQYLMRLVTSQGGVKNGFDFCQNNLY